MKLELETPEDVVLFSLLHRTGTSPSRWIAGVKPANGSEWRAFCVGSAEGATPQEAIDKAVICLTNDIAAIEARGFKPQPPKPSLLDDITLDL
jgi:hypothetical protein